MEKWYDKVTDRSDPVISSRIRLARNLRDYSFASKLSDSDAKAMVAKLRGLSENFERAEGMKYYSCNVNVITETNRNSMVEWHVISPAFAAKKQDTGLILSEDEGISIMLNEEDHLRIQSVTCGADILTAWKRANLIDRLIEDKVEYAYDTRYGYLTSCPTNTGTGLRVSSMLFLPALTLAGKIERLVYETGKYNMVIRGMYGEGTKSQGYLYQVSNQKTLGRSEGELMDNLTQLVEQIVYNEKQLRDDIITNNYYTIEDKVYRSYGVLKYARSLGIDDAMMLLAQVKFGLDTELLKPDVPIKANLHNLMMAVQPASVRQAVGKSLIGEEIDRVRADFLRNVFNGGNGFRDLKQSSAN